MLSHDIVLCLGNNDGHIITVALCNVGYPSETHLKLNSHDGSLGHDLILIHLIVWKFGIKHVNIIPVLPAKFRNDWTSETGEWDFTRFEFKVYFGRISVIAHPPIHPMGLNDKCHIDWGCHRMGAYRFEAGWRTHASQKVVVLGSTCGLSPLSQRQTFVDNWTPRN